MPDRGTIITIGNFDGVHAGHAALVRRARDIAGRDGRVIAIAFDPHPAALLRPERTPPRLTTFARRVQLLRAAGVDDVVRLEPTHQLLALTADEFIRDLVERLAPSCIVEGPDFHFGKGRTGTLDVLRALGERHGFSLHVEPAVSLALNDHTIAPASSSLARWLIAHGRLIDVTRVLGRPHRLEGIVVRGDQRGRTIGFPTANLDCDVMPPGDGVYAGLATLPDGRVFTTALNVGARPTFNGVEHRVEAHLVGATDLPEYGWRLSLDLVAFLRDQVRFDRVERLIEQLHRDAARAATLVSSRPSEVVTCP